MGRKNKNARYHRATSGANRQLPPLSFERPEKPLDSKALFRADNPHNQAITAQFGVLTALRTLLAEPNGLYSRPQIKHRLETEKSAWPPAKIGAYLIIAAEGRAIYEEHSSDSTSIKATVRNYAPTLLERRDGFAVAADSIHPSQSLDCVGVKVDPDLRKTIATESKLLAEQCGVDDWVETKDNPLITLFVVRHNPVLAQQLLMIIQNEIDISPQPIPIALGEVMVP